MCGLQAIIFKLLNNRYFEYYVRIIIVHCWKRIYFQF